MRDSVVGTPMGSDRRAREMTALLRVFMGVLFLTVWASNLAKGLYGAEYVPFLEGWANEAALGWYATFIREVVIPNADLFRILQLVTELVIMGIFLLVGFLTPLSALVAGGFTVNLLLASLGNPTEWPGTYLLMLAVLLALGVSRAGRTWGVDAYLAKRNPKPRVPLY